MTHKLFPAYAFLGVKLITKLEFIYYICIIISILSRFLYVTVVGGVLSHWKTFAFTQSSNDQMVAMAGSVR